MPAQLTAALSGTPTVAAASTAACTEASSDTSMRANTPPISPATRFPPSSFRSATSTAAPDAASTRAVASPRPLAPPETMAAVPFRSMSGSIPAPVVTSPDRTMVMPIAVVVLAPARPPPLPGQGRRPAPRGGTWAGIRSDGRHHQLARLVRPKPGQLVSGGLVAHRLVGEPVGEHRLKVGEPGGRRGKPGKERQAPQLRVAGLDHAQDENLDPRHLGHSVDAYLSRGGRHRRTANRPAQTGNALVGLAEDVVAPGQRHGEVILRTGIPFHEHVVRHHAHPDLRPPHGLPRRRVGLGPKALAAQSLRVPRHTLDRDARF